MQPTRPKPATHLPTRPRPAARQDQRPFFSREDGGRAFFAPGRSPGGAPFFEPSVQAKADGPAVGQKGDPYEREADTMADYVVQGLRASPPAGVGDEWSGSQGKRTPPAVGQTGAGPVIQKNDPPGGAPAPAPVAAPPAPGSAQDTINWAIGLYRTSASSGTRFGRRIATKLVELRNEEEIAFERLQPGTRAVSREGISSWGRADIAVSSAMVRDVVLTSLRLVHEAVHQIQETHYIDEELTARNLQIDYYGELESGLTYNGARYIAAPGTDASLEFQRIRRDNSELVDHIISLYFDVDDFFDQSWVAGHQTDWGGLSRRWPGTKAKYLQVLFDSPFGHANTMITILENINNAQDFMRILTIAGGNNYNAGLEALKRAIRGSYALYSIPYYQRIEALGTRFGVELIQDDD